MKIKAGRIAEHFAAHQRVIDESIAQLAAPAAEGARGLLAARGAPRAAPAEEVARARVGALGAGRKVIAFGNGGSAAQASHLVGELLGRFKETRPPFPPRAPPTHPGPG